MPSNQDELEKKAFRLREFALVLAGALVALSCHHAPVKNTPIDDSPSTSAAATLVVPTGPAVPVAAAPGSPEILAKPLTALGENSEARFSPDGTRIAYISRLRANHKQAQIYELHLQRMTEKRVTFHDGDDSSPSYSWDSQHFLFASTTDAIKEEEFAAEKLMKTYYPSGYEKRVKADGAIEVGSEIYLQTLNGRTIERLTKGSGANAEPDMDPKGRRVLFTSVRGPDKTPHVYVLSGKSQLRLTSGTGVADHSPRFSNDGKNLVFTQKGEDGAWRLLVATGDLSKPALIGGALAAGPAPSATPRSHGTSRRRSNLEFQRRRGDLCFEPCQLLFEFVCGRSQRRVSASLDQRGLRSARAGP